jgi:hypothetical protein
MFEDDTDEIDWSKPHERWRVESALADIDRSIEMAEVRLRPIIELVESLPSILNDHHSDRILYRLAEVELNGHEAHRLAEQVEMLSALWEKRAITREESC